MASPSQCEDNRKLNPALRAWFAEPRGQRLLAVERRLLAELSEDVFGYHLVQLQDFGHGMQALDACPVRKHWLFDRAGGAGVALCADDEQLPLQTDSVDLLVLPHSLDFAVDPHQVLREAERVLIPGGRLIIVGFNPYSLWGLWRLLLRGGGQVPWCGHFLPYPRVADWLGLLGFAVECSDVCAFAPPLHSERWARRLAGLEKLGRRLWPKLAGVYVVRAVKRVSRVTPIKPRWQRLRVPGTRTVEPSARRGVETLTEKNHL